MPVKVNPIQFKSKDIDEKEVAILAKTISKQVDDIDKLVDEFSSFARMPKAIMKVNNFSETIKESFNLFANAHSKINFKITNLEKEILFLFDKFQLSQAINNLIKNAVEAVSHIHNPSIKIDVKEKNNQVICYIIDNGIGVDNKNIVKLFEPYYTTKQKGTGLGLSIVKKIIEDHKGTIKIEKNTQIAGTTVIIIFEK